MPRTHSWIGRTAEILSALKQLDLALLAREDVQEVFGLQRRAALRLMGLVGPVEQQDGWRVDRVVLISWIEQRQGDRIETDVRKSRLVQALQSAESERRRIKAELRNRGLPEPVSWTVSPEAFGARMTSLPLCIEVTEGRILVTFPPSTPIVGAQLLHELSLAMLSDWESFELLATGQSDRSIQLDTFCGKLDNTKQEGVIDLHR